jgi:hypothetical protein
MKPHGKPKPARQSPPDPMLDQAVAAFLRHRAHVKHGRVLLCVEVDEDVTLGYETGSGRTIASEVAAFMSQAPKKGRQ